MDMPARLLLTREAAMSQANSLRISRESKGCLRCLDVRVTW